MRTTDNTCRKVQLTDAEVVDLSGIGNKAIEALRKENEGFLVFPKCLNIHHDGMGESARIFELHRTEGQDDAHTLTTANIMGFVGRNDTHLVIASRFSKDDTNDCFLHYMLQKVFKLNIVNFSMPKSTEESLYDFLLYLFPAHLMAAMRQGLYKEYQRIEHNDANIKGSVDVKRHIRLNMPFAGKIAYTTREYRYDNPVTQLVRHTIEHIKTHPWGAGILRGHSDVADAVNQVEFHTGTYNRNDRRRIINANLMKPVRHPYFTAYRALQQLCLRILRHEKITFGKNDDKIYGILFDGAWLWEEYLNTLLKPIGFKFQQHFKLFQAPEKKFQKIIPDYYREKTPNRSAVVADAKYIPLDRQNEHGDDSEKAISLYYKTITYMYRLNAKQGFLLYPCASGESSKLDRFEIIDTSSVLFRLGIPIPQREERFLMFSHEMKKRETEFIQRLGRISSHCE